MTDDDATTSPGPDLEARLRQTLSRTAGAAPVPPADWGELAGRIAHRTRRRQRLLAGAAGFALLAGGAGGYCRGGGGLDGGTVGVGHHHHDGHPGPRGASAAAGPDIAGSAPCIGVPGPATGVQIGTDTHVFTRTTSDGVTIRVYVEPTPAASGCVPVAQGTASGRAPPRPLPRPPPRSPPRPPQPCPRRPRVRCPSGPR